MRFQLLYALILLLLLHLVSAVPPNSDPPLTWLDAYKRRDFPPNAGFKMQMYRGLPSIDYDIAHARPHPNDWDQVEAAIVDALQLALVAIELIDSDSDIFPHYFDRRDKAKVKEVFGMVATQCKTGNVMLSKIHIQTTDNSNPPGCDEETLLYMRGAASDAPVMILCPPNVFKKKAYTRLKGDTGDPETNPDRYLRCEEITANGHVSYHMESLGALFLHEYLHYDSLVKQVYGRSILDQQLPNGDDAYGPVAVYDNLNKKTQARVNADSYAFYAMHLFWKEVCGVDFEPPRVGVDDIDVDCGGPGPCHASA